MSRARCAPRAAVDSAGRSRQAFLQRAPRGDAERQHSDREE